MENGDSLGANSYLTFCRFSCLTMSSPTVSNSRYYNKRQKAFFICLSLCQEQGLSISCSGRNAVRVERTRCLPFASRGSSSPLLCVYGRPPDIPSDGKEIALAVALCWALFSFLLLLLTACPPLF
jgi:hypothetical protein